MSAVALFVKQTKDNHCKMKEEGGKSSGEQLADYNYYGTFQGVANHPQLVLGFPQPIPPSGAHSSAPPPHYYPHPNHTLPGYAVADGRPAREHRLPCCSMGIGWFLFISGFFLGTIPWYIGALLLLCVRIDYREKPGLIACTLGAMLALIVVTFGVTKATHSW